MDWDTVQLYLDQYGLLAVYAGTIIDHSGLTMFVIGGGAYAAYREDFPLIGVVLCGALGSLTSDAALFCVGRWRAGWIDRIVKREKNKARLELLTESMNYYAVPLLMFGRFIPWLGRFVPATAGIRRVPALKSLFSCMLGSVFGAGVYAALGFTLGKSVTLLEEYSLWIVLGTLFVSFPMAAIILRRFDAAVQKRLRKAVEQRRAPTEPGAG